MIAQTSTTTKTIAKSSTPIALRNVICAVPPKRPNALTKQLAMVAVIKPNWKKCPAMAFERESGAMATTPMGQSATSKQRNFNQTDLFILSKNLRSIARSLAAEIANLCYALPYARIPFTTFPKTSVSR